jgi:transposase-like protein
VRTAEGKLYLYVAIDRTSKFAFVQLVTRKGTSASAFLVALIAAVPYKIHTVLTDNFLCGQANRETGQQISLHQQQPLHS